MCPKPTYLYDFRDFSLKFIQMTEFSADILVDVGLGTGRSLDYPLACLGDRYSGIWKLFRGIATPDQRLEILDWYHLKENLFKVGGSFKRVLKAEAFLWHGNLDDALKTV
jgi:hypothetical protein